MADDRTLPLTRAVGPVGTGVHILRWCEREGGPRVAELWLTVLFFPVVPLGSWVMSEQPERLSSCSVTDVRPPHLGASAAWFLGGIMMGVLSLLPASVALWFFSGHTVAELAGCLVSVGVIIGMLGWLDQTRDRMPIRATVRILASMPAVALDVAREGIRRGRTRG